MHRIFSGDGWLVFPDILKSAHDHCLSQRLLQQPPVLIILCILCIDVQFMVLLDGSAQSRGAGARLAGKREFPKGDRPAFREVARRITPTSPSGRHPRERGRPARMLSLRLPLSFPAMLQPTALPAGTASDRPRRAMASFPVDPGGEDGRGCARLCAGGTPALPGGLHPMRSSHQRDKSAEALWCRLSLKEVNLSSCLFVFIRGLSSCNDRSFFLQMTRTAGAGAPLNTYTGTTGSRSGDRPK